MLLVLIVSFLVEEVKADVFGKYIILETLIKAFMKRAFLVEEVKNVS